MGRDCRNPLAYEKMLPSSDATNVSKYLRRSAEFKKSLGRSKPNASSGRSSQSSTSRRASDSSSGEALPTWTTNPADEDSLSSLVQIARSCSTSSGSLKNSVLTVGRGASLPPSLRIRRTNRSTRSSESQRGHRTAQSGHWRFSVGTCTLPRESFPCCIHATERTRRRDCRSGSTDERVRIALSKVNFEPLSKPKSGYQAHRAAALQDCDYDRVLTWRALRLVGRFQQTQTT